MCVVESTALSLPAFKFSTQQNQIKIHSLPATHDDAKIQKKEFFEQVVVHIPNKESIVLKLLELHSSNGVEVQRGEWLISWERRDDLECQGRLNRGVDI